MTTEEKDRAVVRALRGLRKRVGDSEIIFADGTRIDSALEYAANRLMDNYYVPADQVSN